MQVEARGLRARGLLVTGERGERDDRTGNAGFPKVAADRVPVEPREVDVADDQIEALAEGTRAAEDPAALVHDDVPVALEHGTEELRVPGVGLYEKGVPTGP